MAIKRRKHEPKNAVKELVYTANDRKSYGLFRLSAFKLIGVTRAAARKFDERGYTSDWDVAFEPKLILFYKDIWHCKTAKAARSVVKLLSRYEDINYIEFSGTWVTVDYVRSPGGTHHIPGQDTDDRVNIKGTESRGSY